MERSQPPVDRGPRVEPSRFCKRRPIGPRRAVTACRRSCRGGRPTPGPIDPARRAPRSERTARSVAAAPDAVGCAGAPRPAAAGGGGSSRPEPPPGVLVATLACSSSARCSSPASPSSGRSPRSRVLSDGLPDPTNLGALTFAQPTIVYDRTGKIQLGRFQREQRRVVDVRRGPEARPRRDDDRRGPDVLGRTAASTRRRSSARSPTTPPGTSDRGASTITQQLVRARLLPEDVDRARRGPLPAQGQGADPVVAPDRGLSRARPASSRSSPPTSTRSSTATTPTGSRPPPGSTSASPTSSKLTPPRRRSSPGLPKSPSTFDPYRYAKPDKDGRLVVPPTAPPVVRRDYILQNLSTSRWTSLTPTRARRRPSPSRSSSPATSRCRSRRRTSPGRSAASSRRSSARTRRSRPAATRVITTLDWRAQQLAEKWLAAAAIAPNLKREGVGARCSRSLKIGGARSGLDQRPARQGPPQRRARRARLPDRRRARLRRQRGLLPRRAARAASSSRSTTPPATAPASPARPSSRSSTPRAFDTSKLTPGSLLLDITTEFGRGGLGAARRRPARARPGPRPQGAPVLAQHPGDPGAPAGRQRGGRRPGREVRASGSPAAARPSSRRAWPARSGPSRSARST